MGLDRYAQEDREALCQHNEERKIVASASPDINELLICA